MYHHTYNSGWWPGSWSSKEFGFREVCDSNLPEVRFRLRLVAASSTRPSGTKLHTIEKVLKKPKPLRVPPKSVSREVAGDDW